MPKRTVPLTLYVEMEDIPLGKPFVEDPEVVEDLRPGGESRHETSDGKTG